MNIDNNLSQWLESLPKEAKERFQNGLNKAFDYEPKVAIFGKTGVGKSSLTNALFTRHTLNHALVPSSLRWNR